MKRRIIDWQPEELAWIEAHKDWPRDLLYRAFCARWGRSDIKAGALASLCKRKRWLIGRTTRFQKGHVPWCKGRQIDQHPNAKAARFKPGQPPKNTRYLGHESVRHDGYVYISVAETNPHTGYERRYVQKQRWLWTQLHGPVPEGMVLKCLDGCKTNTDPANWVALPRRILPRLNGIYGRGYDAAPAELKPVIMAVARLAHTAQEVANA